MFGYGDSTKISHGIKGRNKETGAPVRSVFDNNMVPHVWAQGVQTFGQNSNGTLYFHGRALFSYRDSAPIGWLMPDGRAALVSSDSYSVTTSAHQSRAQSATRGACHSVPDLDALLGNLRPPCSGDLDACARFESEIDSRLSDRARVRQFIADRIAREDSPIGESAARYLLAHCGLARSFDKIQRDAIAKRERAKAERAKAERARAIEYLKGCAGVYRQGRAALIGNLTDQAAGYELTDSTAPARAIAQAQKRIRKARATAGKANCPPAAWRDAWQAHALLGDIESDLARAFTDRAASLNALARRRARRRLISDYRESHESGYGAKLSDLSAGAHPFEVACAIIRACNLKARAARSLAHNLGRNSSLAETPHASLIARLFAIAEGCEAFSREAENSESKAALRADYDRTRIEREAQARAEREAREAQARADWLAGDSSVTLRRNLAHFARDCGAAYIRAVNIERNESGEITGGILETSKGADVPLTAAIRAFRFIKLVRARGEGWHRNGARVPVGHFQVDSISPSGDFVAGCHRFVWQDIEALALALGVADLSPDDSAVVRPARAA